MRSTVCTWSPWKLPLLTICIITSIPLDGNRRESIRQIWNSQEKSVHSLVFLLARFCVYSLSFIRCLWLEECLFMRFSRSLLPDYRFCHTHLQYKVLRGGYWVKVNFERHKSQLDKADWSGVLLANPWIRHFRSTRRQQTVTPPPREKSAFGSSEEVCVSRNMALTTAALLANLNPSPLCHSNSCHYDSVGSNIGSSHLYFAIVPGISILP